MALVKFLKETYKAPSVWQAVKSGGWKTLVDGNLAQTTLVHGKKGILVGTDAFGNKYYEQPTLQAGRHRWVVYGNTNWFGFDTSGQEPTSVPPEWHGWLHSITDDAPSRVELKQPMYAIAQFPNKTGKSNCYVPKGNWRTPQKRTWQKIQCWQPPSSAKSVA